MKNKKNLKELKEFVSTESKKEVIKQILPLYRKSHQPFPPVKKKIDECFDLFTQERSDHLLLFSFYQIFSMESLLYLGLITQNHEQRTRYPNSNDSFNPLIFYNMRNPLVVNYQNIFNFTNSSIKSLEKLYSIEIPSNKTLFKDFKI